MRCHRSHRAPCLCMDQVFCDCARRRSLETLDARVKPEHSNCRDERQNQMKVKSFELAAREQLLRSSVYENSDLIHWPVNVENWKLRFIAREGDTRAARQSGFKLTGSRHSAPANRRSG